MDYKDIYLGLIGKKEKYEDVLDDIDREIIEINSKWEKVLGKDKGLYSKEKIDQLKEKIEKRINILSIKKKEFNDKLEIVIEKISKLSNKRFETIKGENIDLFKSCSNFKKHRYNICLHDSDEIIGYVEYREKDINPHHGWSGNVGYLISDFYRGNGYALQALNLLKEILLKEGINEVYIAVEGNNIASRKVAERFGSSLMEEYSDDNYRLYKCDLKMNKRKQ